MDMDDIVELLIKSLASAHQRIGQLETDRGNLHARIEKLMRENQEFNARSRDLKVVS